MRYSTPVALLAILLLAPVALAQAPPLPGAPTPVYTVTIQGAPPAFTGLATTNATSLAPFQVVVVLGNVVCTEATTIPVTITTEAASPPAFFSVAPEPSVINITVAEGPHLMASSPGGGTGDSAARATIAGNITANASVAVTVTASAPAPAGCQGAGTVAAATSEPVTIYANMTAQPAPPEPEPTPEDTPFVGVLAVAVVAVVVAFARRRNP